MTLELENFRACAEEFLALSTKLGDAWIMKDVSNSADFYLEKRCTIANYSGNIGEETCKFVIFVYHIIYSSSYSVPVLYFNAHYPNGKLLTLEEIWNKIPSCYQNLIENKWNIISQQEHPILGIPFFTIHPCHTSDFMSPCKTPNYLISWLSIVGPLAGINLSFAYGKYMSEKSQ